MTASVQTSLASPELGPRAHGEAILYCRGCAFVGARIILKSFHARPQTLGRVKFPRHVEMMLGGVPSRFLVSFSCGEAAKMFQDMPTY